METERTQAPARASTATAWRADEDPAPPSLVRLAGVSKAFGGVQALRQVSFDLRPGEVHAIVGENGAGKSTLVKIITGAHTADAGTLAIRGHLVDRPDPTAIRLMGVAPIYQQPSLFPDLSVSENLAVGLEPAGLWRRIDWRRRRERGAALLARVGIMLDLEAPASNLRMAEQQLVEIARAIGTDARVLVMDEPTAALNDRETARLLDLVRGLRASGAGIIYISHRLEEVLAIADRVSVLRDGELVATMPAPASSAADLIRLMVGREIQAVFPKRPVPIGEIVLQTVRLGSRGSGVHDVDLAIRAGEIMGLAGLVGSGRTELARTLFGLAPADRGEVWLGGGLVRIGTPADAVRHGLAYVPEDRRRHGVIPELSVAANITLASLRAIARRRLGVIDRDRERQVAARYIEQLSIRTPSADAPVELLSGGNQQKVALARWLAVSPRLLMLDEPTQGVDVGAKAEIHRLIVDLAEQGMAILLISSELMEILGMSDRIAVMRAGTIAGTLERAHATPEAILRLALGHGR
jgi:rhamnose transport system ATP-binding protein